MCVHVLYATGQSANCLCSGDSSTVTLDGDIRLVGGLLPAEGRLEIYHKYYLVYICVSLKNYSSLAEEFGAQCATTLFLILMQKLYVDSLDIPR